MSTSISSGRSFNETLGEASVEKATEGDMVVVNLDNQLPLPPTRTSS